MIVAIICGQEIGLLTSPILCAKRMKHITRINATPSFYWWKQSGWERANPVVVQRHRGISKEEGFCRQSRCWGRDLNASWCITAWSFCSSHQPSPSYHQARAFNTLDQDPDDPKHHIYRWSDKFFRMFRRT